jgi:hypothetical protein
MPHRGRMLLHAFPTGSRPQNRLAACAVVPRSAGGRWHAGPGRGPWPGAGSESPLRLAAPGGPRPWNSTGHAPAAGGGTGSLALVGAYHAAAGARLRGSATVAAVVARYLARGAASARPPPGAGPPPGGPGGRRPSESRGRPVTVARRGHQDWQLPVPRPPFSYRHFSEELRIQVKSGPSHYQY